MNLMDVLCRNHDWHVEEGLRQASVEDLQNFLERVEEDEYRKFDRWTKKVRLFLDAHERMSGARAYQLMQDQRQDDLKRQQVQRKEDRRLAWIAIALALLAALKSVLK